MYYFSFHDLQSILQVLQLKFHDLQLTFHDLQLKNAAKIIKK